MKSGASISLLIDEPIERLPRDVEIASVDVRIKCRNGCVRLTVSDDGKGIPQDILAKFRGGAAVGIGLAGMRERLAESGGQINVESSSVGSVVEAVIPTEAGINIKMKMTQNGRSRRDSKGDRAPATCDPAPPSITEPGAAAPE